MNLHTAGHRRGVVCAPHSLAVEDGRAILAEGGNAIEAMLAMAASIAAVYPHMNHIGGDGFWLIREPNGRVRAIMGAGIAGAKATLRFYRDAGHHVIPARGPLAALTVLPLAVIAVSANGHHLIRLEPDGRRSSGDGSAWAEVARSAQPVLPDARPVLADLEGRGDGGHVAVLAGPDGRRYRHGVLGDAIEATRMLWLERHSLQLLRELVLPAPHVMEDIAPRPVAMAGPGR